MSISSILTSPNIYNITQNTAAQISIEKSLKAVGRPGFILVDNNIDKKTKKYSAMKEFLYQLTCLGVYMGIIIPVFKKGAFKIARKMFKDEAVFKAFQNPKDFLAYRELNETQKTAQLKQINKKLGTKYKISDINEDLAKGSIETLSIAGSMLGLSMLAPMVSRPFIRPILKAVGMEINEKEDSQVISDKSKNGKNLDIKG